MTHDQQLALIAAVLKEVALEMAARREKASGLASPRATYSNAESAVLALSPADILARFEAAQQEGQK